MSIVDNIIKVMSDEVGYLEKKSDAQLDSKTANAGSNNFTKYWRDVYPPYQGSEWCACCVTWGIDRVVGKDATKALLYHYPFVYCPTLGSIGANKNQLYTVDNCKAGDIVLFHNGSEYCHTGFVISNNGSSITTIEGNTSGGSTVIANGGGVAKKNYSYSYIKNNKPKTRFFRPKYEQFEKPLPNFKDIAGHYAEKHIKKLVQYGVVNGYDESTFMPEKEVTRAEFATMVTNALEKVANVKMKSSKSFSDCSGHWANDSISKVYSMGIVNGDDTGLFKPENFVTRADACIMAMNMITVCGIGLQSSKGEFEDVKGHYAEKHISTLYNYGVVNGFEDGKFYPDKYITRGQAAIIIANCLTVIGK